MVGAAIYEALSIYMTSETDLWKLILGGLIVVLVVAFPEGIVGFWQRRVQPLLTDRNGPDEEPTREESA